MNYINFLKDMNIVDVDNLLEEIDKSYAFLGWSKIKKANLNQQAALYIIQNEISSYKKAFNMFIKIYNSVILKEIKDGLLNLPELLENMNLYNKLNSVKMLKAKLKQAGLITCENESLLLNIDVNSLSVVNLIQLCSTSQINFIKRKISPDDFNLLTKKYGFDFKSNNSLSIDEEKIINDKISPYIEKLLKTYRGYYFFDQIFWGNKNELHEFWAFYQLDSRDKRILLSCYGNDLSKPLKDNLSNDKKRKLVDLIIPRLKIMKKVPGNRLFSNYQKVINSEDIYTLSMLPQNFIDFIKYVVEDTNYNCYSTCANSLETKDLKNTVNFLMKIVLDSEEMSIINLYFGISDGKRYTLKEISQILSITEFRVTNLFNSAIDKLRLSPHIVILYNKINKKENNTKIVNSLNVRKSKKNMTPNIITNFYGFFTKEEILMLEDGIKSLSKDDRSFINNLFSNGYYNLINVATLLTEEKEYLDIIIKRIKENIAKLQVNDFEILNNHDECNMEWQKIYNICSRIYIDPIFNDVCMNLSKEEYEVLSLALRCDNANAETITYISTLIRMSAQEVRCILISALSKVFEVLKNKASSNQMIFKLINC